MEFDCTFNYRVVNPHRRCLNELEEDGGNERTKMVMVNYYFVCFHRWANCVLRHREEAALNQLLHVSGLTKKFGTFTAVNDLSFGIEAGHCVALLGPNGAGKTTTLNMLSGLLTPSRGTLEFSGMNNGEDRRQHIGYLPQYPSFFNWMTGREFLLLAGQLAHLTKSEAKERADELLQLVGIEDAKNRRIGSYSGGMKQRLGIAQAMIHKPKLLILDEPVSALDPVGRRDVLGMIKELKKETTILFSTHVLHDAEAVSDDVIIIHNGEIVISGSLSVVREKHQKPVIQIQLDHGDVQQIEAWLNVWRERDEVIELTYEQSLVKMIVNDLEKAKALILKDIVDQQLSISKFEVAQTTLEDLFMEAVSV